MMILYIVSFLLLLTKIDALQPHYSYMIVKQKEMVTKGINEKDIRLLDTVEYVASTQSLLHPSSLLFNDAHYLENGLGNNSM